MWVKNGVPRLARGLDLWVRWDIGSLTAHPMQPLSGHWAMRSRRTLLWGGETQSEVPTDPLELAWGSRPSWRSRLAGSQALGHPRHCWM